MLSLKSLWEDLSLPLQLLVTDVNPSRSLVCRGVTPVSVLVFLWPSFCVSVSLLLPFFWGHLSRWIRYALIQSHSEIVGGSWILGAQHPTQFIWFYFLYLPYLNLYDKILERAGDICKKSKGQDSGLHQRVTWREKEALKMYNHNWIV